MERRRVVVIAVVRLRSTAYFSELVCVVGLLVCPLLSSSSSLLSLLLLLVVVVVMVDNGVNLRC